MLPHQLLELIFIPLRDVLAHSLGQGLKERDAPPGWGQIHRLAPVLDLKRADGLSGHMGDHLLQQFHDIPIIGISLIQLQKSELGIVISIDPLVSEIAKEIDEKVKELRARTEEYKKWYELRRTFSEKATDSLVQIYSKMRPESAAAQISVMNQMTAAALIIKLDTRVASAVLNEIEPKKAASLSSLESIGLYRDRTPPQIRIPTPEPSARPVLQARVQDGGAGVTWRGLSMTANGRRLIVEWDPEADLLTAHLRQDLPSGMVEVHVDAVDRVGNRSRQSVSFRVP